MTDEQYENLISLLSIWMGRIYDAVVIGLDSNTRNNLIEAHGNGDLAGPPPWINESTYKKWSGE